jgi:hypothetical protein
MQDAVIPRRAVFVVAAGDAVMSRSNRKPKAPANVVSLAEYRRASGGRCGSG